MALHSRAGLAVSFLLLAGCGGPSAVAPGEDPIDAAAPAITGVGEACATGCIGADLCANADATCEQGFCLFDGREGTSDSYCTVDCSMVACPAGYHCEDVAFQIQRACVADVAVCGNGVVERGETCDDGNTASEDGCRADCRAVDTPLAEQRRARASYTVSGSYVPKGGALTPFTITVAVDSELVASSACGTARDLAGNATWRRFLLSGCADGQRAALQLSVPFRVGSYPTPAEPMYPQLCVQLQLPAPDDAQLSFCATSEANHLSVDSVTGPASAPSDVTARFDGTLAYQPNQAIGGCDGVYATGGCPTEPPATITVTGSFEVVNFQ